MVGGRSAPKLIGREADSGNRAAFQRGKALPIHALPVHRAIERGRAIHAGGLGTNQDLGELKLCPETDASGERVFKQRAIVGINLRRATVGQFLADGIVGQIVRQKTFEVIRVPDVFQSTFIRFFSKAFAQGGDVIRHGMLRSDEEHIARLRLIGFDTGKDGVEGCIDRFNSLRAHFISLHPLQKDASRSQAVFHRAVVFRGEQACHPGAIRIRRFGSDEIVFLARRQERLARIADGDVQLGVLQSVLIDRSARSRHP